MNRAIRILIICASLQSIVFPAFAHPTPPRDEYSDTDDTIVTPENVYSKNWLVTMEGSFEGFIFYKNTPCKLKFADSKIEKMKKTSKMYSAEITDSLDGMPNKTVGKGCWKADINGKSLEYFGNSGVKRAINSKPFVVYWNIVKDSDAAN